MPGSSRRGPAPTRRRLLTMFAAAFALAAFGLGTTSVRASDIIAPSASFTGTELSAVEGAPFTGAVIHGHITLPESAPQTEIVVNPFTATIDWGDGHTSAGTLVWALSNFTVSGAHTWAEEGTYDVAVTLKFFTTEIGTGHSSATVEDAALSTEKCDTEHPSPIFTGDTIGMRGLFSDANPDADLADMSATFDPGDGSATSGIPVTEVKGLFAAQKMFSYSSPGTFTAIITLNDVGGSKATCEREFHVLAYPLSVNAINATEGMEWSGVVGTFSFGKGPDSPEGESSQLHYSIDWGDETPLDTGTFSGGDIHGTHTYVEEGKYTVTVTVSCEPLVTTRSVEGVSVTKFVRTTEADVADAALTATGVDNSAAVAAPFLGTVATFTDANPLTALEDFTTPGGAVIDWGDGSTPTIATIHVMSGGGYSVEGGHTYAAAGKYTVTTIITDVGGATATTKSIMTVGGSIVIITPSGGTQALVSTPSTGAAQGTSPLPGAFLILVGFGLVVAARRNRGRRYSMV